MDTAPNTLAPPEADLSPPRQSQPWQWQLVQVASTYLPVMLMALLAVGTWWLVKNTGGPSDERPVVAPRHEPDYEMHHFAVQRYTPTGALQAQIEGEVLRHYPDTDTLEIDNVRLRTVDEQSRVSVATARHALTNTGATEVHLLGEARVLQEATDTAAAIDFRSETLHAFLEQERVYSDKPVVVTQGATEVHADGMEYTHSDGVIRFTGRARAVFAPKGATP